MEPIIVRIKEQISILEKTAETLSETARMVAIKATQVTQTAMELAMHASRLFGQADDLRRILSGLNGQ
ncbi:MAG: hypothetical protein ACOY5B_17615 [Spirochaetota bacterium]